MDSTELSPTSAPSRKPSRRYWLIGIMGCALVVGLVALTDQLRAVEQSPSASGSKDGQACIECHTTQNVALVED